MRFSFRKTLLYLIIILLYTRVVIYFLSEDVHNDSLNELEEILTNREHNFGRESRVHHKRLGNIDRSILENSNSDSFLENERIRKEKNALQQLESLLKVGKERISEEEGKFRYNTASNQTGNYYGGSKEHMAQKERIKDSHKSNMLLHDVKIVGTANDVDSSKEGKQRKRVGLKDEVFLEGKVSDSNALKVKEDANNIRRSKRDPMKLGNKSDKLHKEQVTITHRSKRMQIAKTNSIGKINVYVYYDIFPQYDNTNLYWNPLFPHLPHQSYFASKLEDDNWIDKTFSRRFIGFLHIYESGFYTFNVGTRMGIDFLVFDNIISNETVIFRFTISEAEMIKQNISLSEVYHSVSNEVWLEKGKAYPIDLTQGTLFFGRFSLKFKRREDAEYKVIDAGYISPLYENASMNVPLPDSYAYTKGMPELRKKFNADKRSIFGSRRHLTSKSCNTGFKTCPYVPSYLYRGDKMKLYYGQAYVKRDLIYPYDHTNYHEEAHKQSKFLNESIAKSIAANIFNSISKENRGVYKLKNIVHVEQNFEKRRYFVELDLKNTKDGKLYRFSDYFVKTGSNGTFCLPEGYANKWRHDVKIYLICAVKNQRLWFQYLIESLEELIARTSDKNLHLITVDFYSTDADLRAYLARSKLNYTFLQMKGNFSKVTGLNEGVRHIPDNDSIVFVMDLQLKIPDHIFDQARKHTIQGTTAYCPSLVRLGGMENPEYTKLTDYSLWQDIGYGMMSIFRSDWDRIGGMNEEMFRFKWGGEDWEFVDRVILGRLELIHQRLPGFYHIYHSTLGTWDGTKLKR